MTSPSTTATTGHSEHPRELVVIGHTRVADGLVSVELAAPDGSKLPSWTPGAHVDLLLTPALTRQYSLCGSPANRTGWRIGVLRETASRGGSRHIHEELRLGARVAVRGPRNSFPLLAAPAYLFLAGGVGITPLLPMIAEAEAAGARWTIFYGGRTRNSMGFLDELAPYGDRVVVWPEDESGMLDIEMILGQPQTGVLVYACGPEGLLQAVEGQCAEWPVGSLHVERFVSKLVDAAAVGRSFEVLCQQSGVTVTVPPDRSILEVVQEAGVPALSSCMEGVCGTCETAVLEGEPDHRDSLLSTKEKAAGNHMMICVSRSYGARLVLDL